MTHFAERFAIAAETMVGAPFRLHGRDAASGMDCVGLVLCALEQAHVRVPPVPRYALRNTDYAYLPRLASACGFGAIGGAIQRGDCIVTTPGPAQRHLHIAISPHSVVHAHAGLRRVVQMPWESSTRITHHWRFAPNPPQQEH